MASAAIADDVLRSLVRPSSTAPIETRNIIIARTAEAGIPVMIQYDTVHPVAIRDAAVSGTPILLSPPNRIKPIVTI